MSDDPAFDLREPQLDLGEPGDPDAAKAAAALIEARPKAAGANLR